jgi:hypothetical protein
VFNPLLESSISNCTYCVAYGRAAAVPGFRNKGPSSPSPTRTSCIHLAFLINAHPIPAYPSRPLWNGEHVHTIFSSSRQHRPGFPPLSTLCFSRSMAAVVAEPTRTKRWDVCPAFPEQIEMRIKWRELDPVRKLYGVCIIWGFRRDEI